jgi:hypothetical protein
MAGPFGVNADGIVRPVRIVQRQRARHEYQNKSPAEAGPVAVNAAQNGYRTLSGRPRATVVVSATHDLITYFGKKGQLFLNVCRKPTSVSTPVGEQRMHV